MQSVLASHNETPANETSSEKTELLSTTDTSSKEAPASSNLGSLFDDHSVSTFSLFEYLPSTDVSSKEEKT